MGASTRSPDLEREFRFAIKLPEETAMGARLEGKVCVITGAGIIALTRHLAMEGRAFGIRAIPSRPG
jgi:hypothetical protein